MKNKTFSLLIACVFAIATVGYSSADSCAISLECGSGCNVTAPAGGSTDCGGSSSFAICASYNADGSFASFDSASCPTGGSTGVTGTFTFSSGTFSGGGVTSGSASASYTSN